MEKESKSNLSDEESEILQDLNNHSHGEEIHPRKRDSCGSTDEECARSSSGNVYVNEVKINISQCFESNKTCSDSNGIDVYGVNEHLYMSSQQLMVNVPEIVISEERDLEINHVDYSLSKSPTINICDDTPMISLSNKKITNKQPITNKDNFCSKLELENKDEDSQFKNAKEFLETLRPSGNCIACKRQSVIDIMVNNKGKVGTKVQLFDGLSNKSPPHNYNHFSSIDSPCTTLAKDRRSLYEKANPLREVTNISMQNVFHNIL